MKKISILFSLILFVGTINAQYEFKNKNELKCTQVKSQDNTGTCWSFATASFIESELLRSGKGEHDLSEIFVVRNIYTDKARNYVLRHGKANFSQGSLAHDLINAINEHGVIPESIYSGLLEGEKKHDHSEMEAGLKGFLDGVIKQRKLTKKWDNAVNSVLDAYLGEVPEKFDYNGSTYTPKQLAEELALNSEDYVHLTSFSHHPFNEKFILEIPDNYSNGSFFNMELDKLMDILDRAVDQGYSVAWDGDVSEKGFNAKKGIAVLPEDAKREDLFEKPGKEMKVTQELRQEAFENYRTTDDHLMHIIGSAKDQDGTKYYIIKNSWGEISPYEGHLYMSESYVRMKTISILLHKDALKEDVGELYYKN